MDLAERKFALSEYLEHGLTDYAGCTNNSNIDRA
jgi:hypothetical protein